MSAWQGEQVALMVLEAITAQGAYFTQALTQALDRAPLPDGARKLATALSRLTIENLIALDYALSQVTDLSRCKRTVKNILRLSAARILYGQGEEAAAVHAAGELCKSAGKGTQTGYVNGVLRALCREKESIAWPKREDDLPLSLSVQYSWPQYAVKQAIRQLGEGEAERMLAMRETVGTVVRVNPRRATREQVQAQLIALGGHCGASTMDELALHVSNCGDITSTPLYQQGWISLHSEASLLAVRQIPKDATRVMDLCAAPGGKALALAERMPQATIFAFDVHEHRVELMRAQAKRLGIENIECDQHDATVPLPQFVNSAQAVLVDAPCSGLGTAIKRPDVKQNRAFDDVLALAALQQRILDVAAGYVAPGGTLVYCTCTFLRQENDEVVQRFLQTHPGFSLLPLDLPDGMEGVVNGTLQLWPHRHGTDGFFLARMVREHGAV